MFRTQRRAALRPTPRFCFDHGVSDLATSASLIVATLDLQVVQLLRAAIRTADLTGQAGRQSSATVLPTVEHRRHDTFHEVCCECEPRRNICCSPVYKPRRVIHPTPRIEFRHAAPRYCDPCDKPGAPEPVAATPSPIQPPWKTLPWQEPPRTTIKVKRVEHRTDIINKGSLIDYFI
ncbi:MAG: hypothetical protein JWL69_1414 [Phycisphaerales bacterium]|nr:hypothetical protein [Phycisphaerales bacterium]MDB5357950.1 hypothetical protein [Phycisphaerales bacterium]